MTGLDSSGLLFDGLKTQTPRTQIVIVHKSDTIAVLFGASECIGHRSSATAARAPEFWAPFV
jgi:hypothetical protein